mmetsp:Transcript_27226/g.79347  ORF Transcript_27226/g.79347 Transcript_27226/m.79347 type:complete len:226 (+) Transcript_27226:687-1364(+)
MERRRLACHTAQGAEGLESLEHGRGLKGHDGEEREDRVLPVLVQHPENRAKDLEDGDWRQQLLLEEFRDLGCRNPKHVPPILLLAVLHLHFTESPSKGVGPHGEVHGAGHNHHGPVLFASANRVPLGILVIQSAGIHKLVALPLKVEAQTSGGGGELDGADRRLAPVLLGQHEDKAALLHLLRGLIERKGLERHEPMAQQKEERRNRQGEEKTYAGHRRGQIGRW